MSLIKVLSAGLQNQIAAGEVVERPASVVKELMENSLDAGAGNIQLYLEGGGQSLIKIIDDGHGLYPEDLPLALTRHATSKISSVEELAGVSSFGFRGEALPSIASISRLTISSCPQSLNQGFYLKLIHGELIDQGPVAMTHGTRVQVENLLANVPARLKFLKTRTTENRKCVESFIRHCLANLDVDFELFSESRSLYRFFQGQSLLDRLRVIWPSQICDSLKEFSWEQQGMSLHGIASSPESAQARPDRLFFYVNKRPVNDRMLISAVRQAYQGQLLSREYPQAVIFIDLPPQEVDVNVHPAKNEVRFRNEKDVFSLVSRGLRFCLKTDIFQAQSGHSDFHDPAGPVFEKRDTYPAREQEKTLRRLKEKHSGFNYKPGSHAPTRQNFAAQAKETSISGRGLSYLGQVERSYLLFLKNYSTLLIVDQHAAHERVMLEKIMRGFKKTVIKRLTLPQSLTIHQSELELLQDLWIDLKKMGFVLEISTDKKLIVSGIPDFLSTNEAIESLRDIMARKKKNLDEMFITIACRTSIKSGTCLTPDEAMGLMAKLLACDNNQFCPHGRPISRELGNKELENMFKRK
jgi:DNA mismatch repair protein MutL